MFDLSDLQSPIIGAPMAGGPSTPALVSAVSSAGGLGFLASGYQTPEKLASDISDVESSTTGPFGVNLFVPERVPDPDSELEAYRKLLEPLAHRLGVELPSGVEFTDDWYDEKLDIILEFSTPVVSFTFGCPSASVIRRLQQKHRLVICTVTSVDEAKVAQEHGADALCVQGVSAGGHRAMFRIRDADPGIDTAELTSAVHRSSSLPIIAAGGISTAKDIAELLRLGANAVQVGTLLLRAPESGTRAAHRAALADPRFTTTQLTRAYSGRLARGLSNKFIRDYSDASPAIYPQVNSLTSILRKADSDNPDVINLWAGCGYRNAREISAHEVVRSLT